jgi:murein hydrolase activator
MRRAGLASLALAAALMPVATGLAQPASLADQRRALRAAEAASQAATERSVRLERQAGAAEDAAERASAQAAALAARAEAAEADIAAARARIAVVDRLIAAERARLAERRAPTTRLVAALQSLARRPAALGLMQPGTTRDAVHVRAVLATVIPAVRARSDEVRAELGRVATLRREATAAAESLNDGRARLEAERLAQLRFEAEQRGRSRALSRDALVESDRALALGEQAREIVDGMARTSADAETRAALLALAGPLPRPGDAPAPRVAAGAYRLPLAGGVVEGLGEVRPSGVRSRGLAIAPERPGAAVVAPAPGRVLFARPFSSYRTVVIVDHGEGWTTLISGLAAASVRRGDSVRAGQPVGRAADGPVAVELRRQGRPFDIVAMID